MDLLAMVLQFRTALFSFLLLCPFLISQPAWAAKPTPKPEATSSADSSQILPVSLGHPAGCFVSSYALNSGAFPDDMIVAGGVSCPPNTDYPAAWHNYSWSSLALPEGNYSMGYAESVSEDSGSGSTFTYHIYQEGTGWTSWVLSPDESPVKLSLLPDLTFIGTAVLTGQGNHIVGNNSGTGIERAVRWTRSGASWLPPEDIGEGAAVAACEDGSVVIGNAGGRDSYWGDGRPWIWTANPGGGGETIQLEPESFVYDITHNGSMIVGARSKPCNSDKCDFFPGPVYWVVENGQWTMHDLEALDGVDSEAIAVAEVNGQAVIVGFGFTAQNGGILRTVAWIPENDGSYGPPLRLEALAANFDSFTWPADINRNGFVLGWSEVEPWGATNEVVWSLFEPLEFQINAGLNEAWYDWDTPGQGFFVTVFPETKRVFLAWFTYDTERPDEDVTATVGEPGHRWLTAIGPYTGGKAELEIELTRGGVFDSASPAPTQELDGTITLEFTSCTLGTVTYDIPSAGRHGVIPINRAALDNVPLCESLAAQPQQSRQ